MRRFSMILCALVILSSGVVFAGEADEGVAQFRPRPLPSDLPRFGIGIKAGSLGIGVQAGTALARRVNLRGGANFFNYNASVTEDNVTYTGSLQLRSVEAKLDLFVIGGFRVTPGLLLYNDNKVTATASIPNGSSVSFGGTRYFSNPADPLRGTAAVSFSKFAPSLGIGFGNLLPRSARHWSLSTDLGVVFSGAPQFALGFGGSACLQNGALCQSAATPSVTANVEAERVKIQGDLNSFKYYPEVSIMFGWKF